MNLPQVGGHLKPSAFGPFLRLTARRRRRNSSQQREDGKTLHNRKDGYTGRRDQGAGCAGVKAVEVFIRLYPQANLSWTISHTISARPG